MTDEGLLAGEKGYKRLMEGNKVLQGMEHPGNGTTSTLDKEILTLIQGAHDDMNDDFNTPKAMARLFELTPKINGLRDGHLKWEELTVETWQKLQETFNAFIFDIFGLKNEMEAAGGNGELVGGLMELLIEIRQNSRTNKDWTTSDLIRDKMNELKVTLKDGKDGTTWSVN